ncbi:MAG: lysozyme inhibitor LprI family protein [Acetobacter papayae]|uniref:lysozyme inhibitor LprI family protein n=1 Tax=Acetobacter papayae TaxID=1076592 RepID=UPI0039E8E9C9
MKTLISILCFLMFLPEVANSAPSAQDLYNQCSEDFFVSSDIVVCLTAKLAASEKRLVSEQKHALMVLDQWDVDQDHKDAAKKKILESNQEFEKYKRDNCNFSMSLMGGSVSNSHEIYEKACRVSLNIHYIEQINGDLLFVQSR